MNTVEVYNNFILTIERSIMLKYDDYTILHDFIRVYIKLFTDLEFSQRCIEKLYSIFIDKLLLPEMYFDIANLLSKYVHYIDCYRYSIFTRLYELTNNIEYIYNVIRYYEHYFAKQFISESIMNNIIRTEHIAKLFVIMLEDNYKILNNKIDKQ